MATAVRCIVAVVIAHSANVLDVFGSGWGAWPVGAAPQSRDLGFPKRSEKAPRGRAIACSFHRDFQQAGQADPGGGSKPRAATSAEDSTGSRNWGARIAIGFGALLGHWSEIHPAS